MGPLASTREHFDPATRIQAADLVDLVSGLLSQISNLENRVRELEEAAREDLRSSSALRYFISVDGFFNARHQVTINGTEGPLHAHSWRVSLKLRPRSLVEDQPSFGFAEARRLLNDQINPYDGKVLNYLPQFSSIPPTTENIAAVLFAGLRSAAEGLKIVLDSVTVWESPTISVTVTCSECRP